MMIRKTKKAKRRQLPCTIALEIAREELTMVVVDRQGGEPQRVRGRQTRWLHEAAGLHSDTGAAELTEALKSLVDQEKLSGASVQVALSSDFCVTRVLAGETDKMLSELRGLRDRSAHYLSLGAGPKVVSEHVRAIDVKNSQAWLTVTNQETLERVVASLEGAGLYPEFIEHSMIAISRAVGRMGGDADSPAIIIEPSERGVDLGISYRGQLLFDYRPGGIHSREHVAEIVEKHLERIQRYANRFFRFASGQIKRVYLVGHCEDAELVRNQFAGSTRLHAEVLTPAAICPTWQCDETVATNPHFLAPLGVAIVESKSLNASAAEQHRPDLMQILRSVDNSPIWPEVQRRLWPVAAAAALGVLIYGAAFLKHRQANDIERQVAAAETESASGTTMRLELENISTRTKYLKVLATDLVNPPLHELLAQIVKNKPEGVFMNKVTLDADSNMLFLGVAHSAELVYEFEGKLKDTPLMNNVAIAGMSPEKLPTNENATGFQIKCKFAGPNDRGERKVGNG